MSIAAIWDRLWWSAMLTIFVGLVWLKFMDPLGLPIIVGFVISGTVGIIKFVAGIRKLIQIKRQEEEIERKAYEELIAEFGEGEAIR